MAKSSSTASKADIQLKSPWSTPPGRVTKGRDPPTPRLVSRGLVEREPRAAEALVLGVDVVDLEMELYLLWKTRGRADMERDARPAVAVGDLDESRRLRRDSEPEAARVPVAECGGILDEQRDQ